MKIHCLRYILSQYIRIIKSSKKNQPASNNISTLITSTALVMDDLAKAGSLSVAIKKLLIVLKYTYQASMVINNKTQATVQYELETINEKTEILQKKK